MELLIFLEKLRKKNTEKCKIKREKYVFQNFPFFSTHDAFKIPRNSSKIIHLAKQVSPYDNKFIVQSYREATKDEFTYLLFDFHQSTPEKVRLRSKIFPSQGTMTVHMNQYED